MGKPVILWEVTGAHEVVPRASSETDLRTLPKIDLGTTLRQWNIPIPVGSRWVASPGPKTDSWVIAPVRSRPPAPPPGGRERRSRERLALELAGLALGLIGGSSDGATPAVPPGMLAHQAANPLTAARAGLELAMESIGRWVDMAADRRLALLDDLGQVLEDIDRSTELLRTVRERGTTRGAGAASRPERFDAVRVIRSCLTLERRLLRDRGIDLDFATSLESTYLRGDPNALFDLLVNLVRNAAEAGGATPAPVTVELTVKGKDLELVVRGRGAPANLSKTRSVAEETFGGAVTVEPALPTGTKCTITLPLPPQREGAL